MAPAWALPALALSPPELLAWGTLRTIVKHCCPRGCSHIFSLLRLTLGMLLVPHSTDQGKNKGRQSNFAALCMGQVQAGCWQRGNSKETTFQCAITLPSPYSPVPHSLLPAVVRGGEQGAGSESGPCMTVPCPLGCSQAHTMARSEN